MNPVHSTPNLILSTGTQVVSLVDLLGQNGTLVFPKGAVGVIVKSPSDLSHAYRVRFAGGHETPLRQNQLVMLAKYKEGEINAFTAVRQDDLFDRVIFRCVIGSRAYGLEEAESDIDYRGVYLPSAEQHWSVYGVPEQVECNETQEFYWELQKFMILALKANPNVLECLYSPVVEKATPLAEQLLEMKSMFMSRLVYQTFNGYVLSQFKKMQADIRNHQQVKWKHVMHLIRLLMSGKTALAEGYVAVHVEEHRELLLAIKRGEVPWEESEALRKRLHAELDSAFRDTKLPERPDYSKANAFLVKARRAACQETLP